ncbi:hypothetical protein [Actinoplanes sp. L3-i22]|uniref:hypothetical protein n=1 Tax=Actinoplanes sp. L3-i22 TaxID=2836373 RepID=UPI001C855AC4|nr:hypothetical protein [Actinoplanes sp. L3-i22]
MRGRLLPLLLKILALWFVATVLAWPFAVLMEGGGDPAEANWGYFWLLFTPVVAVAIAWWYRPAKLGLRPAPLLGRAAAVLAATALTVVAWHAAGMPWWSLPGLAGGNVLVAVLACVGAWAALDRLPPAYLVGLGVGTLAGAILLGVSFEAEGLAAVVTGSTVGTGDGLRIGVALAIVELAAIAVLLVAVWRLIDLWRTGTLGFATDRSRGHWPPKPGQIWFADVPFEESAGESKDRPVLVLRSAGRQAEILKITSQDKSGHPEFYLFLPHAKWRRVLSKDSWLELRPQKLDYHRFRDQRGLARFGTLRIVRRRRRATS